MGLFNNITEKTKKLKNKKEIIVISLLILTILVIRLYISFQGTGFDDDASYFELRQIEHIKETGIPLYDDPLSYGGKIYLFQPLLHYLIAFFSIFTTSIIASKILINIIAVSIIIVVYLISKHITKKDDVSIFTSFISAFIPLLFINTVNTISTLGISILFTLLLTYHFLKINNKKNSLQFIIILILYILTDPSVIFIVLIIITYLFLSWLQGFKITKAELEVSIFSILITTWSLLYFFKDSFRIHGFSVFQNNIPPVLASRLTSNEFIFDSLLLIGIIPLISGIIVIYLYVFFLKKKNPYFLISAVLIIFLLLITQFINIIKGIAFLAIFLTILLGEGLNLLFNYISKLKFKYSHIIVVLILFFTFVFGAIIPTINTAYVNSKYDVSSEIEALNIVKEANVANYGVATAIENGHLTTYFSKSPNIMDNHFLYTENIGSRYSDLKLIFSSATSTKTVELLDKYNAKFILLSKKTKEEFNVSRLSYEKDECFSLLYNKTDTKLYYFRCEAAK